ncbi:MAG TPA: porphobilinogen synthase [Candidatus Omnitrophota bacterium]|nr:porphobilinogen synthase [Candidatus Omnitrophota bacterium]
MTFPTHRPKRLRQNELLRRMIRETRLDADHLVMPLFVREGKNVRKPIASLPGHAQLSVDNLVKEAREVRKLGIPAVLLFGIPGSKDEMASQAYADNGIVQRGVCAIKEKVPGLLVITDVCLCEFTSTGHCGIIWQQERSRGKGGRGKAGGHQDEPVAIDNDATLELLAETAVSHVLAGADMVAPSAMMDGQVQAIRRALDKEGFSQTPVMAYSAKYASAFYGPFRQAAESAPRFGDRRSYQMDCANGVEALREVEADIREGADIVMVKPGLAYLDIIRKVKDTFHVPVAAYNVSGEYAMVKAAARQGWIDGQKTALEILIALRRAGADIVISYHAKEIAGLL